MTTPDQPDSLLKYGIIRNEEMPAYLLSLDKRIGETLGLPPPWPAWSSSVELMEALFQQDGRRVQVKQDNEFHLTTWVEGDFDNTRVQLHGGPANEAGRARMLAELWLMVKE